jgi:hypothetical protein
MKITKKQEKALRNIDRDQRQLTIQRSRVQAIEDFIIDNVEPVDCPTKHYFTDNPDSRLNAYCREFFVPSGTIVTGTIYKIECFWFLVRGRMRLIEGDHTREIEAPCMLKNVVGIKNCGYAHTDCLFYGVIPNPDNTRNLVDICNSFSVLPAEEIMDMGGNKQQLKHKERLNVAAMDL